MHFLAQVRLAVYLHSKRQGSTVEINDVRTYGMLPTKLPINETTTA